jgi:hypothetical protein
MKDNFDQLFKAFNFEVTGDSSELTANGLTIKNLGVSDFQISLREPDLFATNRSAANEIFGVSNKGGMSSNMGVRRLPLAAYPDIELNVV